MNKIKHLIDTENLSDSDIATIFEDAERFLKSSPPKILKDRLIITIFFENSTRTRSSFEIAAKRLGAQVVSLDVSKSSTKKGETLFDTAANLDAMGPDAIVIRHSCPGVPNILSKYVNCSIINGGDGAHAHPTQALLDLFTLKKYLKTIEGKKIAIVGDIKNSRVANSNIKLLNRFKAEIILVAPPQFLPKINLKYTYKLFEAIKEADAIISLRTQTERHKIPIYASLRDYANDFCITKELIGDKNIVILHPGPVHRNIDISDEVLKDERCKVLEQVKNGVAVRMAVLKNLLIDD
jgi:aspartate carbamoyltransferase catalytic subunit